MQFVKEYIDRDSASIIADYLCGDKEYWKAKAQETYTGYLWEMRFGNFVKIACSECFKRFSSFYSVTCMGKCQLNFCIKCWHKIVKEEPLAEDGNVELCGRCDSWPTSQL